MQELRAEDVHKYMDFVLSELQKPIRFEFIGSEKDFEEIIVENMGDLCRGLGLPGIRYISTQKRLNAGGFSIKPDIIVRHVDSSVTIFEVKKASSKYPGLAPTNQMKAVGQLLLYGNVISSFTKVPVRLALIDNKIYYRTYCAFVGNKLPITLIDVQLDRVFVPYYGWKVGE